MTPVPLPPAVILFGAGIVALIGLGARNWQRKRQRSVGLGRVSGSFGLFSLFGCTRLEAEWLPTSYFFQALLEVLSVIHNSKFIIPNS